MIDQIHTLEEVKNGFKEASQNLNVEDFKPTDAKDSIDKYQGMNLKSLNSNKMIQCESIVAVLLVCCASCYTDR